MIGAQDFCGHYDWTFEYLRRTYGEAAVQTYWREAIAFDSQKHAGELMQAKGMDGMEAYWGHTLTQEEAGYHISRTEDVFRIDMHRCPSKGFLLENNLEAYHDYCAHCMGWIAPAAQAAGFTIDHEHNHCGQCWWELHAQDSLPEPGAAASQAGEANVEKSAAWAMGVHHVYHRCALDGAPPS